MTSEGSRRATVTADDHGALLQIVAWFTMVAMILMVFLRLAIRFTATHSAGFDDAIVFAAMLFGIGNVITISFAVVHGLGKREQIRYRAQTATLQTNVWAASMLYISTITLAKLSTLSFTARLSPNRFHARVIWSLFALVLAWGVATVLANAFQCSLPKPWDTVEGHCFDVFAFWIGVGSIDILTDVILILIPFWMFRNLQMRTSRKIIVLLAFTCRILVIAATISRLVYLDNLRHSTDPFWDSINFHISTQCQQTLAVIVACAPSLKNFVDHVTSGMLDLTVQVRTGTNGSESFRMAPLDVTKASSSGPCDNNPNKFSKLGDETGNRNTSRQLFSPGQFRNEGLITSNGRESMDEDTYDEGSLTSHRSNERIIHVRKDWSVERAK